jgi:hypothetical protein
MHSANSEPTVISYQSQALHRCPVCQKYGDDGFPAALPVKICHNYLPEFLLFSQKANCHGHPGFANSSKRSSAFLKIETNIQKARHQLLMQDIKTINILRREKCKKESEKTSLIEECIESILSVALPTWAIFLCRSQSVMVWE